MSANQVLYRLLRLSRAFTAIHKGQGGTYAKRAARSWLVAKGTAPWRIR